MKREKFVVRFFCEAGDVEREACAQAQEVEYAEAVLRFAHDRRRDRVDGLDAVVGKELAESLQDRAERVDGGKGETVRVQHFLAECRFLLHGLDDLDIGRRAPAHDGGTRPNGADMHDAERRGWFHGIHGKHPFRKGRERQGTCFNYSKMFAWNEHGKQILAGRLQDVSFMLN